MNKIASGFTGGAKDLFTGITGVFLQPWRGAKRGGTKGFITGIGKGLVGFVVSPISAALRLGTGLALGVSGAAILLAKGRITLRGKSRFPRFISEKGVIAPYNS